MMNDISQQAMDYQRVEQVIRYLRENFRTHPGLQEIADQVHLSPYHLQRLFKRWAGISPSQFLQFLTVEYAKERLRDSASVLETTLDAGLSSPGRLHDLFVTFEAMTPGEFKHEGQGLRIAYGSHDTPFGRCLLAATERGVCALYFQQPDGEQALEALTGSWPRARLEDRPEQTQALVDRIFAPAPEERSRPFHLLLKGTNFQIKVWQALLAIPAGAMVTYGDLAGYVGRSDATRAVAGAVARNPVSYLIPCHRVISASGQAHGYRWGLARKQAMLAWEAGRRQASRASG